ncbi:MAG: hypothetical protein WKF37_19310 [Bryobacteraceae bacterium]
MRALGLATLALVLSGCAGQTSRNSPITLIPDMDRQGHEPQGDSFYADRRSSRTPVPGTVARGRLKEDDAFITGVVSNQYVGKNPLAIDSDVLRHGQRRFSTYCSPVTIAPVRDVA